MENAVALKVDNMNLSDAMGFSSPTTQSQSSLRRITGTGIHEVVHHILKDAFKKDGKVTKEGIAIIDKFLESLPEKDRKFLEKEIEQRDYKSKKKEDYYEEHLTLYVEGLKNKNIKLDLSTGEKIQNVFLPHINKVFPNIGKKSIKYSVKSFSPIDYFFIFLIPFFQN